MDFNDCKIQKEENNLLTTIDEFEEKIKIIDKLTKEYNKIKEQIKEAMVNLGKSNDLTQVKWTTPKGIKITCSIGKETIYEDATIKTFSEEKLRNEYPEIYEKCCFEKQTKKLVQSGSNDRLVITLPKENEK